MVSAPCVGSRSGSRWIGLIGRGVMHSDTRCSRCEREGGVNKRGGDHRGKKHG
jgi:hypothetical protein